MTVLHSSRRRTPLIASVLSLAFLVIAGFFMQYSEQRSAKPMQAKPLPIAESELLKNIPLPFETHTSTIKASIRYFAQNQNAIDVWAIALKDTSVDREQDFVPENQIFLVLTPSGSPMMPLPLDSAILQKNANGTSTAGSVDYFGYQYTTKTATDELANQGKVDFRNRFPGTFFASAQARQNDASHGNRIRNFEDFYRVTFKPTDGSPESVMWMPNSLYIIVPNTYPSKVRLLPPPVCGDGYIQDTEQCDDGNTVSGDGCSATCNMESGWICSGAPSTCAQTPPVSATACASAGSLGAHIVMDDARTGYTESGSWTTIPVGYLDALRNTSATSTIGSATATWCAKDMTPGRYEVRATWPGWDDASAQVTYAVFNGYPPTGGTIGRLKTVFVNQKMHASGSVLGGSNVQWQSLGTVTFTSGTGAVRLFSAIDGGAIADGVWFVPLDTSSSSSSASGAGSTGSSTGGSAGSSTSGGSTGGSGGNSSSASSAGTSSAGSSTGGSAGSSTAGSTGSSTGGSTGSASSSASSAGSSIGGGNQSICGNGILQSGEQCDDGNTANQDGCDSQCRIETGFECQGQPSTCSCTLVQPPPPPMCYYDNKGCGALICTTCGNGTIESPEECDKGVNNGKIGVLCTNRCKLIIPFGGLCGGSPCPVVASGSVHVYQVTNTGVRFEIPYRVGSVNFGQLGGANGIRSKTFLVENAGTGTVKLGSTISVPDGFTVDQTFTKTTLKPGDITTFIVRFWGSVLGTTYSGVTSFVTNESMRNPFTFTVYGQGG